MRIRHSQEMSVAQKQFLFNGEVLLTNCNSDNQSSFQIYQYGFPFPILPNLNLLPEKMSSTDMGEVISSPSTPITLDKNKRIQDRLSQEVIDLVVGSASNGSILQQFGFSQPVAEELSGILPKPILSSQLVSSQQPDGEMNVAKSSEEISLQPPEIVEHEKGENQGIDLNKTPQQKPKRKKHRPKVIREGKPARTPKPVTPKPVTPKPAREKGSSSGKRKYVRKKGILNSSNNPSCPRWENVDPKSASHTKSARRCLNFNAEVPHEKVGKVDQESASQTRTARCYLNFNAEGPQQRVGFLGPSIMFSHTSEAQSQDACMSSSITRFTTTSAVRPAKGRRVKENSPAGIKFDLNNSANDMATEHVIIPQTPVPSSHPSRRGVMGIHCMLNGHKNVMNNPPPPPQPSRREIIQESLKQFAWKNGSQKAACYLGISTECGQKSQLNLHNSSDMLFTGGKRDHTLVGGNHNSKNIDFVNDYNRTNSFTENHPYLPENHKKRRLEKKQNACSSNSSHETCTPSCGLNTNVVVPNNCQDYKFSHAQMPMVTHMKMSPVVPDSCQVYSFADAQRLVAREKVRASEHMLSFEQREVGTKTVMETPTGANSSAPQMTTKGNSLSTPVKPVRLTNTDCNQSFDSSDYAVKNKEGRISTPAKSSVLTNTDSNQHSTSVIVYRYNGSQANETHGPQTCAEILSTNKHVKVRTKNCTTGEQTRSVRSKSLNSKQMSIQEEEAASSSYDLSHGKISTQLSGSALGNGKVKKIYSQVSSRQDVQSSTNFNELPHGIPVPKAIVFHGDPINDIVQKMECLSINEIRETIAAEVQNALVPYGEGGTMIVPYEGPFDPTKKRRARAKVDLDPETERVWKLLMGKEGCDGGTEMDKEKWWENERRVFHGRVDSFIARMHLVQGDRRFSRWKGSVVDSVVGVFLTQNVSDHLSSSAFMSMAARFPIKQNSNNRGHNERQESSSMEQQDSGLISFDHSMLKATISGQELCHQGSLPLAEADCIAGVLITNNNEPFQSNNSNSVLSEHKQDFQKREFEIGHSPLDYDRGTAVTLTGCMNAAEPEDRRSMDDVVSSQNSVISSQNSSENLVQTVSNVKLRSLSEFDSEGLMNGGMCNVLDGSTSFMDLLHMEEGTRFPEQYNHGNGRSLYTECCGADDQIAWLETDKKTYVSNQEIPPKEECSSMYRPNYQPYDTHHDIMGVSSAPFMSYNFQNPAHSNFMAIHNISGVRAESISHLHPAVSGINITNDINKMGRIFNPLAECSMQNLSQNNFKDMPCTSSSSLQNSVPSGSMRMRNINSVREENSSYFPTTSSVINSENRVKKMESRVPLTYNSTPVVSWDGLMGTSYTSSPSYHLYSYSSPRSTAVGDINAEREERSDLPLTASGMQTANNINIMNGYVPLVEKSTEETIQQMSSTLKKIPALDICYSINKHSVQPLALSETESCGDKHHCCQSNLTQEQTKSSEEKITSEKTATFQQKERGAEQVKCSEHTARIQAGMQNDGIHETCLNSHGSSRETSEASEAIESNLKDESYRSQKVTATVANNVSKGKKVKAATQKDTSDWDSLRKLVSCNEAKKERSGDAMDTVDWEAVRCSDVKEISQTIRERGMNNMLAERIKEFLNRLMNDHGSIDLEWLRDVPPASAKDYLLSIRGLGLKSVECVRLLTLHHLAFPVDTNVGRICVRLGWVPLQPLPESLQLHLLEMYPVLETIQKYLWPRLCKLDQRTLYELHYQLITFGKVFCTKSKPNCNACPMRGECKHFASAFASARLALPGPEEKRLVSSTVPPVSDIARHTSVLNPTPVLKLEGGTFSWEGTVFSNCEPIIEEPATPEPEFTETSESAIEDAFDEDPEEIPTIKLNLENFTKNLQDYVQKNNLELQEADMSKALVSITAEAASIPMPRLKNVSRLRTEHRVYELPDSHPLLEGLDQREPDDPCFYLLAIWSPGETSQSSEQSTKRCDSQDVGKLCDKKTCFACNNIREAQSQTVRATLLIPCRTAMRGSFPLNGTYFQVNEVFADHDSSRNPMNVPREWIWNLPRRTVYFGTSIPTIFKGLTTEGIQHCFWRGFVCIRGFDRTTRGPKPLYARLHIPASKTVRNKKAFAAMANEEELGVQK